MNSFFTYLRNVRAELAHVVWPSQRQAVSHVALIILISILTALWIALLDYAFTRLIGTVLS